ncbi:unnamed protein product, partial [Brenthis ino]
MSIDFCKKMWKLLASGHLAYYCIKNERLNYMANASIYKKIPIYFRSSTVISDKLKIVTEFESGKSRNEIQRELNLTESTYYKIIKSKDSIKSECSDGHGNIKKTRVSEFPNIEKCLLEWIKQTLDMNIPLDGLLLKEKSKQFATKLGIKNFSASNGWLEGFKKRHDIAFKKAAGESKSLDQGVCNHWTKDLPNLLEGY